MKLLSLTAAVATLCALRVLAQDNQPAPLIPLPANGLVSLETITGDFRNSPDAATNKYQGNLLIVYGRVGQLKTPGGENPHSVLDVYLQDEKNASPDVKAVFQQDALPENTSLDVSGDGSQAILFVRRGNDVIRRQEPFITVNQQIAVQGSFKELMAGDIKLENCTLVSPERLRELMQEATQAVTVPSNP
jgi:hypothetical protein